MLIGCWSASEAASCLLVVRFCGLTVDESSFVFGFSYWIRLQREFAAYGGWRNAETRWFRDLYLCVYVYVTCWFRGLVFLFGVCLCLAVVLCGGFRFGFFERLLRMCLGFDFGFVGFGLGFGFCLWVWIWWFWFGCVVCGFGVLYSCIFWGLEYQEFGVLIFLYLGFWCLGLWLCGLERYNDCRVCFAYLFWFAFWVGFAWNLLVFDYVGLC